MSNKCVRDKLLAIIDDIEIISKELFENALTPKPQRQLANIDHSHSQLAELLVAKDKELKHELKSAEEQEEIQKKMDALKAEVDKQDEQIKLLQKHLKEAEHILATALYQAKQKVALITKANEHPISSEELIKYAHRISSSHAVAAPYNWEQGDTRRPYPTDIEMRQGFLGQCNTDPIASGMHSQQNLYGQQQQQQLTELTRPSSTASTSSSSSYAWQNDVKPNLSTIANALQQHPGSGIDVKSTNKENMEDVEVMSTDSSTSSSSDSQ